MMMHISVGKETTDDELKLIRATFGKEFNLQIDNNLIRLSERDWLPLAIYFVINASASGAIWDGIKFAIQAFFVKKPTLTKRNVNIKITTNKKYAIISDKRKIIQEEEKVIEIESLDELIKCLREHADS